MALQNARLYERARQEVDERKQAEARIQRLLDHQMAVNRLALAVSEYRDLSRIYHTVYEHIKASMDVRTLIVSFYDEDNQCIRAEYVVDNDVVLEASGLRPIPFKGTMSGTQSRVICTGEPFYVPDLSKVVMDTLDETAQEGGAVSLEQGLLREHVNNSAVFVPLKLEGEAVSATVGVIQVQSQRLNAYTQDDVDLLSAIANVTALAIQNARLFVDVQRSAQRLQSLYETSRALSSSLDEESLMRVILERMYHALDCEHVIISTVDYEAKKIGFKHGIWFGEFDVFPDWIQMSQYPLDHNDILADIYRKGHPEIIEEWDERFNREIWESFSHERLQRIFMPMKIGERVIGVIEVGYSKGEHGHIDADIVQMLTAFMDQAAVALENARLFQSEKEQRELAEALEEAATVVNSSLELDQVLDRILEQIERVVVGDTFNVMLIEDHVARIVRSRGYHQLGMEQQAQELVLRVEDYVNLRAIRSGETYLVLDTHNDPDWELLPGWEQIHSYLGVPIHIKGKTAGILSVEGTQVAQFNAHDAHRLEAFASHAATAVENAQLFQQLRHYADDLEALVQARTVELQAQYAWLDAVLRSVSDGIIVVDTLGKILQMNSVAETWLNQTLTLEDAKRLRSAVKVLATRAFERPAKTLTLTGLDLHLHAAPISEPGMEQVAVVAVHDISHLKALNRMKSQFVSNVSHELRTPVTTIKLYANLLQHCAPEKRPDYLDALSKEADRQAALVEDILQISRIDAGKLELRPKLISLSQLIEDVIRHHKLLARAQGLKLEHRILGMIPKMVVDPERVTQVLNNLLENAIRYTPAGGSVVISTDRVTREDRAWVLVHVADTGIGIPEEELPYVFDRFFRGVGPRQMQKPGTGLGLTIVKEIVELHGGRVAVESHVGEGSTFTVWLPLALPSSDDAP